MFKKFVEMIFITFFLSNFSMAQEPDWFNKLKQITPLESNEKNVEKIFGKPDEQFADVREYKIGEVYLSVTYSEGRCSQNKNSEYDVEKGKVIEIDVTINDDIKFKSLNIDLSGFREKYTYDLPDLVTYVNEKKGINFTVDNEFLGSISIYPAEKFSYLKCSPDSEKSKNEGDEEFLEIPMINVTGISLRQNQSLVESNTMGSDPVKNGCLKSSQLVNVSIKTTVDELEEKFKKKFPYTRRYTVTAGRIVGQGSEVLWDLSGVEPGTYRITADAAHIDGFFRGISRTIEICVVEK